MISEITSSGSIDGQDRRLKGGLTSLNEVLLLVPHPCTGNTCSHIVSRFQWCGNERGNTTSDEVHVELKSCMTNDTDNDRETHQCTQLNLLSLGSHA